MLLFCPVLARNAYAEAIDRRSHDPTSSVQYLVDRSAVHYNQLCPSQRAPHNAIIGSPQTPTCDPAVACLIRWLPDMHEKKRRRNPTTARKKSAMASLSVRTRAKAPRRAKRTSNAAGGRQGCFVHGFAPRPENRSPLLAPVSGAIFTEHFPHLPQHVPLYIDAFP